MWWKITLASVLGLVVLIAAALIYGARRWQHETEAMWARMDDGRQPIVPTTYDPQELEALPAPVQRYLSTVLSEGQPLIAAVNIEHTGTFNTSDDGEQWVPFTSKQRTVTKRPGFDWDARIAMAPGVTAFVHDAYITGEGILYASAFGLVPVMDQRGTPEITHGEFLRYVAESAWYPTALLPSQGAVWEPVDDASAKVTLTDGEVSATMTFHFNEEGLIDWVRADARGRTANGETTYAPWEGRWWNYARRDGMLVPSEGEVSWLLPEQRLPYWRGKIAALRYEWAE